VAGCLNNLGALLDRMDKPAEAEPLAAPLASPSLKRRTAPDHVRTAHGRKPIWQNTLGALGDTAAAPRISKIALCASMNRAAGPNHFLVASALNGIAVTKRPSRPDA